MRKQIPTRVVNERLAEMMDIEENVRFGADLSRDTNGFLFTRKARPSNEPIAIIADKNRLYWDIDDEVIEDYPLYGRPFIHTAFDCYTFLRDYYKRTYGITLPSVEYEDNWWDGGNDYYKENINRAGFYVVNPPLKVGDVIAMKVLSPVINHTAVYIGDGMIAHHMPDDVSKQERYRPAFLKMSVGYYRHKEIPS